MTEEQMLQARIEGLKKQELKYYLEAMATVRSYYPGEKIDLDWITDLEIANRVWYFAERGVNAQHLKYFWNMEGDLKQQGYGVFERLKLMDKAISRAPSFMFRADFDRTKAS